MKKIAVWCTSIMAVTILITLVASNMMMMLETGKAYRTLGISKAVLPKINDENLKRFMLSQLLADYCSMKQNSNLVLFRFTLGKPMEQLAQELEKLRAEYNTSKQNHTVEVCDPTDYLLDYSKVRNNS